MREQFFRKSIFCRILLSGGFWVLTFSTKGATECVLKKGFYEIVVETLKNT